MTSRPTQPTGREPLSMSELERAFE
jgi:hypothetical protein